MRNFRNLVLSLAALSLSISFTAHAASDAVTIVVPFPPGGSSDTIMRAMTPVLGTELNTVVVVDNKPGANGTIGASQVVRSAPDGRRLLAASGGTFAVTPFLLKKQPFDARKDFDLLSVTVRTPNMIAVRPDFPANSVAELIQVMKSRPNQISFASSGIGASDHLSALLFWQKTGTQGTHIAFRGLGPAINDLMAGHVDVLMGNTGILLTHVKSGRLKALSVLSEQRLTELPSVPAIAETGLKGMEVYAWEAVAAPRGLDPKVRDALARSIQKALVAPAVRRSLLEAGYEIVGSSPEEFKALLETEVTRWKKVAMDANVQLE